MTWDPFASRRQRRENDRGRGDREQPQSIGGQADGRAGGSSWPVRRTMNERLREAHEDMKQKRSAE